MMMKAFLIVGLGGVTLLGGNVMSPPSLLSPSQALYDLMQEEVEGLVPREGDIVAIELQDIQVLGEEGDRTNMHVDNQQVEVFSERIQAWFYQRGFGTLMIRKMDGDEEMLATFARPISNIFFSCNHKILFILLATDSLYSYEQDIDGYPINNADVTCFEYSFAIGQYVPIVNFVGTQTNRIVEVVCSATDPYKITFVTSNGAKKCVTIEDYCGAC